MDVAHFRRVAESRSASAFWALPTTPGEALAEAARWAESQGLGWDRYGEDGAVALLEAELVERADVEAAAFFPSGTMAQQCALRVWCDRSTAPPGRRIALPDLSHLLVHEDDGPRLLHGFRFEHLTTGWRTPSVADLDALPGELAVVLLELPLRDAGCLLPSWEELVAVAAAVHERGAVLHLDGARVWEAQASYGRPLAELVGLADTTYVSFYKGLGGLAGAALLGPADVLAEARRWRRRMGGTLFHLTAEATTALRGLREPPDLVSVLAWARRLAAALPGHGITPWPGVPHVSTFRVFAEGEPERVNERLLALVEREDLALGGLWQAGREPGRVEAELTCSTASLDHDPERVAALLGEAVDS